MTLLGEAVGVVGEPTSPGVEGNAEGLVPGTWFEFWVGEPASGAP